jgi:hypothetical protein
MTDTTEIRSEMAMTRDQMSRDIDDLKARAKQRLDVVRVVREHPWTSLGVAIAVGAAVGSTGAEKKAAVATVGVARRAIEKMRSDPEPSEPARDVVESSTPKRGMGTRLGAMLGVAAVGVLDRVLHEMRVAARNWSVREPRMTRPVANDVAIPAPLAALGEQALITKAVDAIPVPNEIAPAELGLRADAVEAVGGGTHEPPLEPGAGELGARWS